MNPFRPLLLLVVVIALAACQTTTPPASKPILPQPTRLVTDTAGILSAEDIAALEADLQDVEKRGLAQMLIYITPSVPPGEVMEDLTLRSVNAWGLGRAGYDDGVAIFVFVDDRKVRIELGL